MPLDYADFAHHYEGQELNDAEKQAHFDVMADLLDCIVRLFWRDPGVDNPLGISLDENTIRMADELGSTPFQITDIFNDAATKDMARKQDS